MLFEFKSRATGSVVMTESIGKKVLELIGKSPDKQGIITVAQMPQAMQTLQKAADRDKELARKAREAKPATSPAAAAGGSAGSGDTDEHDADDASIGIGPRVFPLIEMMEEAHKAGKDITWGV